MVVNGRGQPHGFLKKIKLLYATFLSYFTPVAPISIGHLFCFYVACLPSGSTVSHSRPGPFQIQES